MTRVVGILGACLGLALLALLLAGCAHRLKTYDHQHQEASKTTWEQSAQSDRQESKTSAKVEERRKVSRRVKTVTRPDGTKEVTVTDTTTATGSTSTAVVAASASTKSAGAGETSQASQASQRGVNESKPAAGPWWARPLCWLVGLALLVALVWWGCKKLRMPLP